LTELERIAAALREATRDGADALLATVVACEGSTYRRVGARMLLTAAGSIGAISGGCLEADVHARRERLRARGLPELAVYDARSSHELVLGLGLGCNGRVELLLEPLAGAALDAASRCFARAVTARTALLATVVATSAPERVALGARWLADAEEAPRVDRAFTRRAHEIEGAAVEVLWEQVLPAPRLTVCGGGNDAIPLVRFAAQLGWSVSLLEHRAAFAGAARFPEAAACVLIRDGRVAKALEASAPDAVVVMSHHFERDLEYLAAALATPVPYIGVLGPRARTERFLAELGVDAAARARIYAPLGLDLGADTPEEIALAAVSEMLAVRRGRRGAPLRERRGPIHGDFEEGGDA
jgi:xanthine/CO dehydrogenase XdhC/CoxF family maturation factor